MFSSLLHCLNKRKAYLGNPTSWDWVLRDPVVGCFGPALHLMEEEGLLALTDRVRQSSKDIYWHNTALWVRRENQLKPILDAFDDANIEVIPLKGAVLLETLYKKIGLRIMTDIDVLVRSQDFIKAAERVLSAGMKPKWAFEPGNLFEFTRMPLEFWPGELSFYDGQRFHFDLHRDLVTSHWFKVPYPVSMDEVWKRPRKGGDQVEPANMLWKARLCPYDMLAHLCLHLGLHGIQIVKNFYDVDQWLRNLPEYWDWVHYLNITKVWQIQSVSYHVFFFCQGLFGTPVPDWVMDSLTPSRCDRWMVRRLITPQAILTNHPTLGMRYPSLVKFALFDGFTIKLKTIRNLLFPKKSWLRCNSKYQDILNHWINLFKVVWRGD